MIKQITNWVMNNAIYLVLVLLLIAITVISPDFLTVNNFRLILTQASTRIIIALGVGGILITQGTDLSAGRIVGVGAVLSASLLQATDYPYRMYPNLIELPLIIPILITMVICAFFGLVNGVIVAIFKVPPFIATLGTMIIIYGLNSIYFDRPPLGAQPIGGLAKKFTTFVQGDLILGSFEIPYLIIYTTIVIGIIRGNS
ncbi:MAG: beta-methylgalactoside transporter, partial [Okeania sp. SIO3C4]|nr:beta-methylgalactoside transporter [Okeania sp. SIO3C4]